MDERQASALTANLVMFTGLLLFLAAQLRSPYGANDVWPALALDSPAMCRLAARTPDGYVETLTRTVVEGETTTLVPLDAPDCDE